MTAWRRVASGLVLALVAIALVAAAALAKIPKLPTWAAVLAASIAFAAGLLTDPFKKLIAEWIERPGREHAALLAHTRMHDRKGQLQRVRDCTDPIALGVHPAAVRACSQKAAKHLARSPSSAQYQPRRKPELRSRRPVSKGAPQSAGRSVRRRHVRGPLAELIPA